MNSNGRDAKRQRRDPDDDDDDEEEDDLAVPAAARSAAVEASIVDDDDDDDRDLAAAIAASKVGFESESDAARDTKDTVAWHVCRAEFVRNLCEAALLVDEQIRGMTSDRSADAHVDANLAQLQVVRRDLVRELNEGLARWDALREKEGR